MTYKENQDTAKYLLLGELGGKKIESRVDFDGKYFVGIDGEGQIIEGRMGLTPAKSYGARNTLVFTTTDDTYNVGRLISNDINRDFPDEFAGIETSVSMGRSARVTLTPVLD